ncbi:MAG: hypothetical protein Q7U10_10300 [Thermodesulfovibrionia bacterium]|nr:hypothetical protein [Thermodesulfovibrionia bacterium]
MIISKLKYIFIRPDYRTGRIAAPAFLIVLSLLFSLIVSCSGGGGGSASSDSTSVTINLGQRERIAGALSLQVIPDSVVSVVIRVTGPSMSPIVRTINIYDFTGLQELIQVPSGADRLFEVIAHDESDGNGILLFKGQAEADLAGTPVSLTVIMQSTDYNNMLVNGLNAFEAGDILSARDFLKEAVLLYGNSTTNDADEARFFYALTRVFALGFEISSDGNVSNGINTAGEIADLFDCIVSGVSPIDPLFDVVCPQLMPANSPTVGQLQDYLYDVVRPELIGAIDGFNQISETFNVLWLEPQKPDSTPIESDYGDVLALRAAAKSMLSLILTQQAYDLDIDIDATFPKIEVGGDGDGICETGETCSISISTTKQQFLADNPGFLSLTDSAHLVTAKSYLTSSALDDSVAAIEWIQLEGDDQSDDFINIDVGPNPWQISQLEIDEAKADIAAAKTCLNGSCTLDDNQTPGVPTDDTIMDFSRFYAGAVNFRSLLPSFSGDEAQGFLPDPSFGGVLIQSEGYLPSVINEDLNSNSLADIFEDDLYYVYGGNVLPADPYSWDFRKDPEAYDYTRLGVANSSDGVRNFTGLYGYYLIQNFRYRGFMNDNYDVKVDAIQFFRSELDQGYCCPQTWSSTPFPSLFMGSPDGAVFDMNSHDFILMQAPATSADNITVYTSP